MLEGNRCRPNAAIQLQVVTSKARLSAPRYGSERHRVAMASSKLAPDSCKR